MRARAEVCHEHELTWVSADEVLQLPQLNLLRPRDARYPVLPYWLDSTELNGWDQQSQNLGGTVLQSLPNLYLNSLCMSMLDIYLLSC